MNSSQQWLFLSYNQAGPVFPLVASALVLNFVSLLGMAFNLFLVYTTLANKALRSNTNYLLMLTSLFEAMHETWSLVFLVVALSGQNFIRFDTSFWLQSLAIFGVTAAQIAMAATSIDRLLAVGFPISYNVVGDQHRVLYLSVNTGVCIVSGICMTLFSYVCCASKYDDIPVTGFIGDLFFGDMSILFMLFNVCCAIAIACYSTIGAVIIYYRRSGRLSAVNNSTKTLVSLVVILGIVVGGYLVNNFIRFFIDGHINLPPLFAYYLNIIGSLFLMIGVAANVPILFIFSTEYKKALKEQFKQLVSRVRKVIGLPQNTHEQSLQAPIRNSWIGNTH